MERPIRLVKTFIRHKTLSAFRATQGRPRSTSVLLGRKLVLLDKRGSYQANTVYGYYSGPQRVSKAKQGFLMSTQGLFELNRPFASPDMNITTVISYYILPLRKARVPSPLASGVTSLRGAIRTRLITWYRVDDVHQTRIT